MQIIFFLDLSGNDSVLLIETIDCLYVLLLQNECIKLFKYRKKVIKISSLAYAVLSPTSHDSHLWWKWNGTENIKMGIESMDKEPTKIVYAPLAVIYWTLITVFLFFLTVIGKFVWDSHPCVCM